MDKLRRVLKIALYSATALAVCATTAILEPYAYGAGRGFTMLPGTVTNYELPNFNDKTGWKDWELLGGKAKYIDDTRIDLEKILLKIFEGENKLKVSIRSDYGKMNPTTKIANSEAEIFVNGEGFSLEGKGWQWNAPEKHTEIFKDVRGKFSALNTIELDANKMGNASETDDTTVESESGELSYGGDTNDFRFSWKVKVRGKDMALDCESLLINALKGGEKNGGRIKMIEATGNVSMRREAYEARSEKSTILPDKETVLFELNPMISDTKSGATIAGHEIEIFKNKNLLEARSSGSQRAIAIFKQSQKPNIPPQTITVSADKISMRGGEKNNDFDFLGNVKVSTPDFVATCDTLKAIAAVTAADKREIVSIHGLGNITFANESGNASSDILTVNPKTSEVELEKNAVLTDKKSGMKVIAQTIVFERAKDSGRALAAENSFVKTTIPDNTASIDDINGSSSTVNKTNSDKDKSSETTILSRKIDFSRSGNELEVLFKDDVSIKSSTANAECDELKVLAYSDDNNHSAIKKITAIGDVKMKNEGYSAHSKIAEIYPKSKIDNTKQDSIHRLVELSTPEDSPQDRPSIKLPPLGNIGLNDSEELKIDKDAPTIITSDRQTLSSTEDGTDIYLFDGNVEVRGANLNADCDKIGVVMKSPKPNGKKQITKIEMRGGVKMDQGMKHAECESADIFTEKQIVHLYRDAFVYNREDNTRVAAPSLIYNAGTRRFSMENATGVESSQQPTIVLPSFDKVKRDKAARDAEKANSN